MKNRLIVDIYWCALSATWCCKTFTMIHAQNIVVQKIFVRAEGDAAASPASPLDPPLGPGAARKILQRAHKVTKHGTI